MNSIEYVDKVTFSGTEIVGATINSEVSLVGDTLSADEFSAKVKTSLTGETHVYTNLMEWYCTSNDEYYYVDDGDLADFTYGDKIRLNRNENLYEQFYVRKVSRYGQQLYEIDSISAIGMLIHQTHVGGVYQAVQVGDLIDEIMQGTGISYQVSSAVANTPVSGWLPYGNKRDNLQQILFAVGANIRKENGVVNFLYYAPTEAIPISDRKISLGGKNSYESPASQIILTEHSFFVNPSAVAEEVFSGAVDDGIVVFNDPVDPSTIQGSGFTIHDSGANYAHVTGSGTITAKKYTHQTTDLSWSNSSLGEERTLTYKNNTLVTALNSVNVLNRLKKYYADSREIDMTFSVETEKCGDYITFNDAYYEERQGFIRQLNISCSGRNKGVAKVITDWYPSDTGSAFTGYELFQESGTINVSSLHPEAVGKPARLVLMGGFEGGSSGTAGENGTGNSYSEGATYIEPGQGGESGGAGGNGGNRVKVKTIDIASMPTSFSISEVGVGGPGGTRSTTSTSNIGSLGGDTSVTVGGSTYSTADSDASENSSGFINIIDGTFYNYPGKAGYSNTAKGGDGVRDAAGKRGGSFSAMGQTWLGGKQGKASHPGGSTFFGGGGGAAAFGMEGGEGGDGAVGRAGSGGIGATPSIPNQASFGHCGDGGHGGGAGGGAGGGYVYPGTGVSTSGGGRGGYGSAGGQGSNGGVLWYFGGN